MQDPDKTIAIPSGYGAQEWPQGQAPAAQPGQFPPSPYGQPPTPQAAYGQSNQAPGPGQFAAYTPQSRPGFPQAPGNPQPQKKRTLLWASLGALVLLLLGIGGVLAFTHTPAQNTTAQSQSTAATAQASQSASGKNASASSSAQSGASSDNNSLQAQATAVATALAQAQSQAQANNLPGQAQALAQAGAPADVATSFFAAIQRQDYATAYTQPFLFTSENW